MRTTMWNIGTWTDRSGELAEVLKRRKVNICCVQKTMVLVYLSNIGRGDEN